MNNSNKRQLFFAVITIIFTLVIISTWIYKDFIYVEPVTTKDNPNNISMQLSEEQSMEIAKLMEELKNNPNDSKLLFRTGVLFFEISDYQRSINFFLKAHELDPNNIDVIKFLGANFYVLDQYEDSAKFFEELLKLNDDPSVKFNLAIIYKHFLNNNDKALLIFEELNKTKDLPSDIKDKVKEELAK